MYGDCTDREFDLMKYPVCGTCGKRADLILDADDLQSGRLLCAGCALVEMDEAAENRSAA